jgi:hypothetical protein
MRVKIMRLFALLIVGAAAGVTAACAGDQRAAGACAGDPARSTPTASAAAPSEILAVVVPANEPAVLGRFDALTLKPRSRQARLGEYHDAWSVSPDGAMVALGLSASGAPGAGGRVGIRIFDLSSLKPVREVETGIAAVGVAWLAPRALVASLLEDGVVLVDPRTGKIVRRWRGFSSPQAAVRSGDTFVMLFGGGANGTGAARLAIVDDSGRLRSVVVGRIRPVGGPEGAIALAVDRVGWRAYVAAAGRPVAAVDLKTLRVSYHVELAPVALDDDAVPRAQQRRAVAAGDGAIAVFGRELVTRAGRLDAVPAGVTLIDTDDWSACLLDARASGAVVTAGRLLTYGPRLPVSRDEPGVGLRAYTVGGKEIFHRFDDAKVTEVDVVGGRAYVRSGAALHVVDVAAGEVVATNASAPEIADIIGAP